MTPPPSTPTPPGPAADEPSPVPPEVLPGGLLAALGRCLLLLDDGLRVVAVHGRLPAAGGAEMGGEAPGLVGHRAAELFPGGLLDQGGALLLRLQAGQRLACGTSFLRLPLARAAAHPVEVSLLALDGSDGGPSYALEVRDLELAGAAGDVLDPPLLFHGVAARSAAVRGVFRHLAQRAADGGPLLVVGEPGTGREQLARVLHALSPRRESPFVVVNCAALPDALAEADLFGSVAAARGGTLYLDGVAALRPALQQRLARELVDGEGPGGGPSPSVRLVVSTDDSWRDPGAPRLDPVLHQWLQSRPDRRTLLRLPPLRHRLEDVEPLAIAFLDRTSARDGVRWSLSPEALSVLLRHRWPGNLRELEGALEHACAVGRPPRIEAVDLPADLLFDASDLVQAAVQDPGNGFSPAGEGVEGSAADAGDGDPAVPWVPTAAVLRQALVAHGWRCREVAEALSVDRTALWLRLRELGWLR